MRGEGVSRDHSRHRPCSGKRKIGNCKVKGNLDNFVIIDVDGDGVDDVIIIDVPESLQKKLRGSSVLKEGKRFPCIISIDDDDCNGDKGDKIDHPKINAEGSGNLHDSHINSTKSSFVSDPMRKSAHVDADDCWVIRETTTTFMLSKCRKLHTIKSPSRSRYGMTSESETDPSEISSSDCEVMEGSSGELHEQWEKASLKKKSNVGKDRTSQEGQGGPSVHPNVEVQYETKQNYEASVCSSTGNVYSEKINPFLFTASRDECVSGSSFNSRMENPCAKSGMIDEDSFSWWDHRARENTDSWRKDHVHFRDQSGAENIFGWASSSQNAMRGPQCCSSFNIEEIFDKYYHHTRACSQDMKHDILGESTIPHSQLRSNMHASCGKGGVNDDDSCLREGQYSGERKSVAPRIVVLEEKDEFSRAPSRVNTCSNEEVHKSTWSNDKEKLASGDEFAGDIVVENVAASSEDRVRAVLEEASMTPLWGTPGVGDKTTCCQDIEKKTDSEERSVGITQCQERLNKPGTSRSAEGKESLIGFVSNSLQNTDRDQLCISFGEVMPVSQRDIINEREKLKETDEYKRAAEEEWAKRQQQLQIQAEEAQRLRKRKKAESLRILDMEKRQKQRLEEVRDTQKKDEENLNMKERLRVEIMEELCKLESTCINMASLLRGLGIRVEGGFHPPSHELHAAYKRALLKFHPDRVSRTDIRQQVEAEEKFKLISRMKKKLLSTSCL